MKLEEFNTADAARANAVAYKCCASNAWAKNFVAARPFADVTKMLEVADDTWFALAKDDFLEAFRGHSKIGNLASLKEKYGNTQAWSKQEQAGVASAQDETLNGLITSNNDYETKMGFIFIIFATGKSAEEMLTALKERMNNSAAEELINACIEQSKITKLRLEKLQ